MLTVNSHSLDIAGTPPGQAGRRLLHSTAPTAPTQELEGDLRLPYNQAPSTVGGRTGSTGRQAQRTRKKLRKQPPL